MATSSTLRDVQNSVLLLKKTADFTTKKAYEALQFLKSVFWVDQKQCAKEATRHGLGQLFVKIAKALLKSKSRYFNTEVIGLYWNYTDDCPELGCELGKYGAIDYIINLLNGNTTESLQNPSSRDIFGLLSILHNSVRHDECINNRSIYRKAGAVQLLKKWIDSSEIVLKIESLLVLAYITNEAESDILGSDSKGVAFLVIMLKEAVKGGSHNVSVRNSSFSSSEILKGLSKLVINDSNKKVVLKNGGIPAINRMLKSDFTEEEQSMAAGVLWTLSFDEETRNSDDFKKSLAALKPLTTSGNQDVRQASRNAIWQMTIQPSKDKKTKEETGKHVMISYNWTHQKVALQIQDHLQRAGFEVWIDVDKMSGDILEAMASAVNNSATVLLCMSQQYYESTSCRSEAEYAYKKKKHMIPLLMEEDYEPEGWLDILIGTKLYYKVCSETLFRQNIPAISKAIGERHGKGADHVDGPVRRQHAEITGATPGGATAATSEARAWSSDRVQVWFDDIKLPQLKSSLEFFVGSDLETLYRDSSNEDKFASYCKTCEECGLREIEIRRLSSALRKLFL